MSSGSEFQSWGAERMKAPHGDKTGGRDREVDRGGRSEGTGRGGNEEEFRQVGRGKIMEGLQCKQEDFEVCMEFDWEPGELLQNVIMW